MADKPDMKKLIAENPLVDAEKVRESIGIIRELEQAGVKPSGYNLRPPFSTSPPASSDAESDPRTVHIGR